MMRTCTLGLVLQKALTRFRLCVHYLEILHMRACMSVAGWMHVHVCTRAHGKPETDL